MRLLFSLVLSLVLSNTLAQRQGFFFATTQPGTPSVAKTYTPIPTAPTFADPNTITLSGNQTVNTTLLAGKVDQLINPGQAAAWTLNNIGSNLIRFKSLNIANKAIIGDGTVPLQKSVRTLNTSRFFELYDLILYSNQGGTGPSAGSTPETSVGMYVQNVGMYRHTFAGIWSNTGEGYFDYLNTSFVTVIDLDGGAADGTDGGEGYYIGNTSPSSRSIIYESKHDNIYINKAAREGIQMTSVSDLLMRNMTIRNSGTWGAAGTGQNRMGQIQFCNGLLRDNIWDDGASSFEVFGHGTVFYNNYFRWTNDDRFYLGNTVNPEPLLNGEPIIFDYCVFKSTLGTDPLFLVALKTADVIVRNCIISDNISGLFTDNRGGGSSNTLIDGGGNTFVPAASIPDPTYVIDPDFNLHLTYASTGAMTADQANQINGRPYLVGSTYYTKKNVSTANIDDYIITEPAYVVTSDFHYNRFMGFRTPPDPLQPDDITLSDVTFEDGNSINDVIGTLAVVGGSGSYNFTVLTEGYRAEDGADFNTSGSNLRAGVVFDAGTQDQYYVRVRAASATNAMRYVDKIFSIDIIGGPTVATDINLSASAINENVADGSTVGTISDDSYPSSTYSLVSGTGSTDNASFSVSGTSLLIETVPDYETKTSYAIRLRATNTGDASTYEEQFTITINDLADGADADYTAIITRAGVLGYTAPSGGQQSIHNQMVLDLKAAGLWTLTDVLYVFAQDGSYQFGLLNWKSPSTNQATRPGNAAWTSNVGFKYGTGTNGHIELDWAPSEGVNYTQNNAGFMLGKELTSTSQTYLMSEDGNNTNRMQFRTGGGVSSNFWGINNATTSIGSQSTADAAIYHLQRTASNAIALYKNNTLIDSRTTVSAARSTQNVTIAAFRDFDDASVTTGGSTGEISFVWIGSSLNSTQRGDLYTIMNTYISGL